MKSAAVILSALLALSLCGCQKADDATYTTSYGSGTETITLHRDGTYTSLIQHYAEDDKNRSDDKHRRRKENPFETLTTQGSWSLVDGQSHLPNGFPVGGLIALHSSFDPEAGSHTMPMIGSREDRFGHFGQDRTLPAAVFSDTFRAIRN